MARKIKWTLAAYEDVDQAAEFVAKTSTAYAAVPVERVLIAVRSLESHAERGSPVEELEEANLRELYVDGYRLIYSVQADVVVFLACIHTARDLRAVWSARKQGP